MARKLSPLGLIFKWVGVPVGFCVVGYFLVGPRIGSSVSPQIRKIAGDQFTMLNNRVHKFVAPAPAPAPSESNSPTEPVTPPPANQGTSASSAQRPNQSDQGGPEVHVSVHSANTRSSQIRRHRHHTTAKPKVHHKSKPKPKPEATDQGSYGGTQDQGVTPTSVGDPPTGG